MKGAQTFRVYLGLTASDGCPLPAARVETCRRVVASVWQAFTVYEARGVWQGQAEACLVFERIGAADEADVARRMAAVLCRLASQSAVLVTQTPCAAELIEQSER